MKILFLAAQRLKQYLLRNRSIFILFVIGGILNSMVFAYLYGNLRPILYNWNSEDNSYRLYNVAFDAEVYEGGSYSITKPEKNHITSEQLESIESSGLFKTVISGHSAAYPQDIFGNEEPAKSVYAIISGVPNVSVIRGTISIKSPEEIVVGDESNYKVGDIVSIYGQDFTVIGVFSGEDSYFVSPEGYNRLGIFTNYASVLSNERWHSGITDDDVPLEFLEEAFPEAYVYSTAERLEMRDLRESLRGFWSTVITYVISVVAFIFLLVHMADSLAEENTASLIVGGKSVRISVQVFIEGTLLSAVSAVLGIFVHVLLYKPLFEKINIVDNLRYLPSHYFEMAAVMIAIDAVVTLIVSLKYSKLSPIVLRRNMEG